MLREQVMWIYAQLNSLSPQTLVSIIDELNQGFHDNEFKEMALDIYMKVKQGYNISDKQKNVLVNVICQLRR